MYLEKIKMLEDLNEELRGLESELNKQLEEKRKTKKNELVENAFSQFKDFFEKQGFKVNSLNGTVKTFTASYKTTSFSMMWHNDKFLITHSGKEICSVVITEKIPGKRRSFSAAGGSHIDNEINIVNQQIDSVKHSLENLDSFDCLYRDYSGNYEYQSLTDILNKYFK